MWDRLEPVMTASRKISASCRIFLGRLRRLVLTRPSGPDAARCGPGLSLSWLSVLCWSGLPTPREPDVRCGHPGLRSLHAGCASPSMATLAAEPGFRGMGNPSRYSQFEKREAAWGGGRCRPSLWYLFNFVISRHRSRHEFRAQRSCVPASKRCNRRGNLLLLDLMSARAHRSGNRVIRRGCPCPESRRC